MAMNNLIFYQNQKEIILCGMIVSMRRTQRSYMLYLSGIHGHVQRQICVYFWQNSKSSPRYNMYERVEKSNLKIGGFVIIKAIKDAGGNLKATDFCYAGNTLSLGTFEKEENILTGKIRNIQDYESCKQITLISRTYENGKTKLIWPRITFFKNNESTCKIDERLINKSAIIKCGANNPYKGNPSYIGDFLEIIETNELSKCFSI